MTCAAPASQAETFWMFLLTYLRRELRRRLRQSVAVSLGLTVAVGLMLTVTAASTGEGRVGLGAAVHVRGEY